MRALIVKYTVTGRKIKIGHLTVYAEMQNSERHKQVYCKHLSVLMWHGAGKEVARLLALARAFICHTM